MGGKKYLVLSDSHGHTEYFEAVMPFLDQVEGVLHLGDHLADLAVLRGLRPNDSKDFYRGVRGNCDEASTGPLELILEMDGHKVLLSHGHRFDVKVSLNPLFYRASELGAQVVLYGHSHISDTTVHSGVIFHNPGSIALPKGGTKRCFSIMTIDAAGVTFDFHDVEKI